MISVIISSAKAEMLKQVCKNVEDTIGVEFEIIPIDNSDGKRGICEVYNLGAKKAKYDIICFMHEDIAIKTLSWGEKVVEIFNTVPNLGLLGVAGSGYKTISPSGWNGRHTYSDYGNLIQSFKFSGKEAAHYYSNPQDAKFVEVACIDGVWFCTPKKVAIEIKFDQDTFKGFHAYDIDYSLAVSQRYKVGVIFSVLMDHFSEGRYDHRWMIDNLKLHQKWNKYLPLNILQLNRKQIIFAEKSTFKYFIQQLIELKFPMSEAFKMIELNRKFWLLDVKLYFKLRYYIVKMYLFK